jgi:hypothetical protein
MVCKRRHHELALIPPTPYNIATPHSHTEVKKVKNHFIHHRMPLVTPFQLLAFYKNNNLCPLYDGLQNPHHKLALIPPTPYNIATSHSHTEVKRVKNHLKHHIMRPLVTPFQLPATHKNIILSPLFDGLQKAPPRTCPNPTHVLDSGDLVGQ